MRKLIVAASAIALAAPAMGQPRPDPRDEEIRHQLPPPGEIEEIGERLGDVADALMDVPIGPIADAIDPERRRYRDRDETLGDLATRRDPYARERMRDEIDAVSVGLGAAVEQMAVLTPVLRRSLEEAIRRMEDAIDTPRRDRRDDPDRNRR